MDDEYTGGGYRTLDSYNATDGDYVKRSAAATTKRRTAFIMLSLVVVGLILVIILSTTLGAGDDDHDHPTVELSHGKLMGVELDGVNQYLGIPFARSPIGSLRFRPPQPAAQWSGTRRAQRFASACIQQHSNGTIWGSEDCLYLNVYVPKHKSDSLRPVMVYIYGGYFVGGASFYFPGQHLVERGDVIYVSVAYRLGMLGFLSHPGLATENSSWPTSGNYGLLDQQLALKWVQNNIKAFGGDPSRVTVFGESAGSISICFHLVIPTSEALFKRVIMESGACTQGVLNAAGYDYGNATRTGELATEHLHCNRSTSAEEIACLRQLPASSILLAQATFQEGAFFPTIDHHVIPDDPRQAFTAGQFQLVDMLIGTNIAEGTSLSPLPPTLSDVQYRAVLTSNYGSVVADRIYELYPSANFTLQDGHSASWYAAAAVSTDQFFVCPSRFILNQMSARHANVYEYVFDHLSSFLRCPTGPTCYEGITHASELPYVFGIAQMPFYPPQAHFAFTKEEITLSDLMISYWTTFSRAGAFKAAVFPKYLPNQSFRRLSTTPANGARYKEALCDFWDSVS